MFFVFSFFFHLCSEQVIPLSACVPQFMDTPHFLLMFCWLKYILETSWKTKSLAFRLCIVWPYHQSCCVNTTLSNLKQHLGTLAFSALWSLLQFCDSPALSQIQVVNWALSWPADATMHVDFFTHWSLILREKNTKRFTEEETNMLTDKIKQYF